MNSAKYFLPYASFFQEKLKRDNYVKRTNKKNKINDYYNFCTKNKIQLLNVENSNYFEFNNNNLISQKKIIKKYFLDKSHDEYLRDFERKNSRINKEFIEDYFKNSGFHDNLVLIVSLTDSLFKKSKLQFYVCFDKKFSFKFIKNARTYKKMFSSKRILHLKIRKEAFINCVKNAKPWEDLLIGFQVKINRNPNVFNSKFWNHFSNIYVSKKKELKQ